MDSKKIYRAFCKNNDNIPLFHQPWWLDIITENNWDVAISTENNGTIKAAMPYMIKRKFGLPVILQSGLTPFLGVLFFYPPDIAKRTSIYSFQNKHLSSIIENLPKNLIYHYSKFLPEFDNWLPFYNNGYEQSIRYTYIIDNIKDHDEVYNNFTNTIKRQIKEAKDKVKITHEDNICLVFALVKESVEKQGLKFLYKREVLKVLEKKLSEINQSKIFIARDENGNATSGLFLVWDKRKAYMLGLGTSQKYGNNNSTKLLIWESIKYVSQFVDKYDFEGSMLAGVERLYRSFGGKRTQYYEVKKYKNKYYKAIFALLNK